MGLCFVFFSIGIKHVTALLAGLMDALGPVLSTTWVALVVSEVPGVYAVLGGALIVGAVTVYNSALGVKRQQKD